MTPFPPWPRNRTLLKLSVPVAVSLVVQNAMGLVTTAMIGALGDAALAGVGVAGAFFSILMALLFGVDAAVQASVARRSGADQPGEAALALADGLWIAGGLSVPLAIASAVVIPLLLGPALHDAAAVREGAANILGLSPILLPLALNMTFGAYWNGVGLPHRATAVYLVQLPVHVLLVWGLTFGHLGLPALGVFGAGLGSCLAATGSTVLHVALIARRARPTGGLLRPPPWSRIRPLLAIGAPISLQQSLHFVALTLVFVVIGQIGVRAVAAVNVVSQIVNLAFYVTTGVGVGAATLVGGALGRGDPDDARAWGRQAAVLGAVVLAPVTLLLALAPPAILGLFIHTPATIETATLPLRIAAFTIVAGAVSGVLNFSLRGAGYTAWPAAIAFALTWVVELPLAWLVGVTLGLGLPGVTGVLLGKTVVEAAAMVWLWRRGGWRRQPPSPLPAAPRRLAILGGGGAGKSTLARTLGERLGLPVIHLDLLVYDPGWRRVSDAELGRRLAPLLGDTWIVEGSYAAASALTLPRADAVLWLEAPVWLRLLRCWRKVRAYRGRPRPDRPDGCPEVFGWTYVGQIVAFGRWTPSIGRHLDGLAPGVEVRRMTAKSAATLFAPSNVDIPAKRPEILEDQAVSARS